MTFLTRPPALPGAPPDSAGMSAGQRPSVTRRAAPSIADQVFEQADAGLLVLDVRQRIRRANAAARSLLGLTATPPREGWPGFDRWPLFDAAGRELGAQERPAARMTRTGEIQRHPVLRLDAADGQPHWLRITASPVKGDDDPAAVTLLTLVDVSDQTRREQDQAGEWQRMLDIVRASRLGIWHHDLGSSGLRLDEMAASLIGAPADASPDEALRTWARRTDPRDRERMLRALTADLEAGMVHPVVESRIRTDDGEVRWVRLRTHAQRDPGTGRLTRLTGTVEDVTAFKTAEQNARHSHELLEALFEQAPIGIQLVDLQSGRTLKCNQALADVVGLSIEQSLQTELSTLLEPEQAPQRRLWRRELMALGRTGPHEIRVRHGEQGWRDVRLGAVRVWDPHEHPFAWAIAQDITIGKAMEAQLKSAAVRDRLTGLHNRQAVQSHLQAMLVAVGRPRSDGFATLFLDFDRFKRVNDTLGHAVGDGLLVAVSGRLRAIVPEADGWMAARLGGDEFVIVVPDIASANQLQPFLQTLLETLRPAYLIEGHELHSSASIGVSLSAGRSTDTERLLREADIAMYEAKHRGRGQVVFFDADMEARLSRSVRIEDSLHHAVSRGELSVAYQPIIDLDNRRMVGAEALLRWTHPVLGPVSPAEFIPIAEESGHILAIGEWVLEAACRQWLVWKASHPQRCPDTVSVNLSRVELAQGSRLVERIRAVLERTGLPARHLQLEVTEREVVQALDDMAALLRELHALGIQLAMDDFGTGASSLGCLRHLPFDTIKIDKSFIADLSHNVQALAIAQATIHVIDNLGMRSVAEGIESPDDVSVLQALGCQLGQGFLFCRPVPGDRLMDSWR